MNNTIDRRSFLKSMMAAGAAGAAAASLPSVLLHTACRKTSPEKSPNIVLFLADDLGYGDLGCYGHPVIRTPHLDRLASEGVRFTDCHSGGTVCSPARAALLTGRNPYRVGIYYLTGGGAHLRREEITVASRLREAGYDTCFLGKWHLGELDDPSRGQPDPGAHGFDHWFATELNAFEGPEHPTTFVRNGEKVPEVEGWYCDAIVKEALDWLDGREDPDRPFFLVVASHEPHAPIQPPEKYAALYEGDEVDRLARTIPYGGVELDRESIFENKKYFFGTVTQLDDAFGRLMSGLDERGRREDTCVIFTSDNGPETPADYRIRPDEEPPVWVIRRSRCFGSPGDLRGMKRYTYEGGHRVPGIVRWPGRAEPGTTCDELITGPDLLPTLCEMAGVPAPADRTIDGASWLPVLEGGRVFREIPACWMFPAGYTGWPHMAMREGRKTLLGWFGDKPDDELWMDYLKRARLERFELYDLESDPRQENDLAEARPDEVSRLSARMREVWRGIQADGPVWPEWTRK